ncbi:MAG: baseplate J/gp47 family protein [Sphingomonas sp.]
MTFTRPTKTEIRARIGADFDTRLPGADSRVRRNVIDVLAGAHAGVADGLHAMIAVRARFFPAPDNPEMNAVWASLKGITRKSAEAAIGHATLTGTDGVTVEDGTILVRADGARYVVTADATIAAGTASAAISAVEPGVAGEMETGQALSFQSPVAGISATAIVAAPGVLGGLDQESEADFCGRIQDELRRPSAGGKASDYEKWAKSVPGVTRAWVEGNWDGLGTVRVLFVCDGREDIIPTGGDVTLVTAAVEAQRPVTAEVTVAAPTATPLNFTFTALTPDTPEVRAAIAAELADLLSREAVPEGTIPLSHFREAVSIAPGEVDYTMTAPSAAVTAASGYISTMGTITWPA